MESDREEVVKLGEMALKSKLDHLKSHGRLTHYRFYLAWRAKLLNQDQESWDLNGFLEHFDFPSISEAIKEQKGMTGMCCAVMAGDTKIIRQLVEHRADANARLSGMGDMGYYDTQTVLMMAAKSHQDSSVLATLMTLRADPNIMSRSGISAAWLVRRPSHVQVMLEYRADLYGSFPLNGTAGRASPETVLALLECRCDPTEHTEQGFGALHSVGVFGRANLRCLETARLLLDWRADVNLAAGNSDWMMTMEVLTARMRVALFGLADSTSYSRKVASIHGATPLHMAALQGDKGLVKLLLEYDAELSPNRRGDTPEDLARACGHHDLLPMLSVFQV